MNRYLQFSANGVRWRRLLLAMLGVGLVAIFWLPTRFPPLPAASESFMFGFNNKLCQALFATLVLAVAVVAKTGGLAWPQSSRDAGTGPGDLSARLLALCLVIATALCGAIYWLAEPLGGIGDGAYFLDRIHLMQRGQAPFRDLEFIYGSASLHLSVFLGRLLRVSADNGYHLLWLTETLTGIYLLWLAIRWIELAAGGKRAVFLLCFGVAIFFIPTDAPNYCILRYSLPLFGLTGLCRLDRDRSFVTRFAVVAFALGITAALLNLSPEEGLVYGVAICVYLPLRRFYARQPFLPDTTLIVAGFAALCLERANAGMFVTMRRLAAGAFNLPVYPGPHILLALAAFLALACYLASGTVAQRVRSNVTLLTIYSFGMLPGALGRCDTAHIVGYLLPVLICAMLLSWSWRPAWRAATASFAVFFLLLPFALMQMIQPPILSKALLNHLYKGGAPRGVVPSALDHLATALAVKFMGRQRGISKISALRNASFATEVDPRSVFPGASAVVAVPFEYMPNKLSNYQAPWVNEGRFMGTLNVLAPSDVDLKISELRLHPEQDLVISSEGLASCEARVGDRTEIRVLLQLPWVPRPRHEDALLVPLCNYIQHGYAFLYPPSPATFGYGLMRRKPGA